MGGGNAVLFWLLRSGEATLPSETAYDPGAHLSFADVSVNSIVAPRMVRVKLRSSKTDPFRKGVDIFVGRTHNKLCPVEAMQAYLVLGQPKKGFLFKFKDGRPLTKKRFVKAVREALGRAGRNPKDYAGHSFRRGAATTASQRGVDEATIKMGRWESSAYQLYIQMPRERLAAVSAIVG